MSSTFPPQDEDNKIEPYPIEPRYHPVNRIVRKAYDFLASSKLAIALLIIILLCCLSGVTIYRGEQATKMVFGTLWFNGLLVFLVINVACCFFGRMWGRRVTIITSGMILFHLSFVAMFIAIACNSLFYFDGTLRLTEGETLSNRDPKSYDNARHGLLFSYSRLKGETTLLRVHRGFKIDGGEKDIAYDISVAEGSLTSKGTIYITNKFIYKGVEYIRDKEGYSLLTILNGRQGNELYGAHIPLQSFKRENGSHSYSTGTAAGPGLISFPPEKNKEQFDLQLDYLTDSKKDRAGSVRFQVWPVATPSGAAGHSRSHQENAGGAHGADSPHTMGQQHATGGMATGAGDTMNSPADGAAGRQKTQRLADGIANIGDKFAFGDHQLLVPEVRYWVGMYVSYNPGKAFVLGSLCMGLAGIIITTIGRIVRGRKYTSGS